MRCTMHVDLRDNVKNQSTFCQIPKEKQKLIYDDMLIYDICEYIMNAFSSFAANLIR